MEKGMIIISMPCTSTQDEIDTIRKQYSDRYIVHIFISGTQQAKIIIKDFIEQNNAG